MADALPDFIPPMLARIGDAFDSEDHLFEIKWDGIRALAFVDGGGYRLRSRRDNDLVPRYPELAFLAGLPPGTVLDGELVVLRDGKADFPAVIQREQQQTELRVRGLVRQAPVTYVVFDLLYEAHEAIVGRSLVERRERLAEVVAAYSSPHFVFSDGIVGAGLATFEEVRRQGIEGMVAKRLDSPYLPGKRTDDWTKVKTKHEIPCVILGYLSDDSGDVRSLVIGAEEGGGLHCVGRVGSGLTDSMRARLRELLEPRRRDEPIVECDFDGVWVEPGLFCNVSFFERTSTGMLRGPVFLDLHSEGT